MKKCYTFKYQPLTHSHSSSACSVCAFCHFKILECDKDYNIKIRGVEIKNGAEFIVVLAGKIMTMPGLPKEPAAEKIDILDNGEVVGIF